MSEQDRASRHRRIGLFVFLIGGFAFPAFSQRPGGSPWVEPTREEPPGTKYKTFHSRTIDKPVSYLLYLPPGYDEQAGKRYPVLFWLPGGNLDQRGGGSIVAFLDKAIREKKLPPLIVIACHGPMGSNWTDSKDGTVPIETVFVKDLIPHIDATYRTIPMREARWIEGMSMGGRGAAHLGFEYPELFGAVSIAAGALLDVGFFTQFLDGARFQGTFGGSREYFDRHDPFLLVEKNAAAIRGKTLVRILVGDSDTMGDMVKGYTVFKADQAFHDRLESLRIPHEFIVVPGVTHVFAPLYENLGDRALEFFKQAFARMPSGAGRQ